MPELKNVVEGPIYRIMMEYVTLIRPGDVILSVDGRSVYNSNTFLVKHLLISPVLLLLIWPRSPPSVQVLSLLVLPAILFT